MASWNSVGTGIWYRVYLFGGTPINTPAIDIGDGKLMVISPGTDLEDADFEELDALGSVTALVSPGAFHHLGLPIWAERYPNASLYGPTSAVGHIAKQHPDLKPLEPVSVLAESLPDDIELGEIEGAKHPDIFLAIRRDEHVTWVTNEVITNNTNYPDKFLFKWAFKLSGNHPGLNINSLAAMLIGAKKPAVRAFYEAKMEQSAPTRLLPCHGDVLTEESLAEKLREVMARRM